jgi:hypothetical protein
MQTSESEDGRERPARCFRDFDILEKVDCCGEMIGKN